MHYHTFNHVHVMSPSCPFSDRKMMMLLSCCFCLSFFVLFVCILLCHGYYFCVCTCYSVYLIEYNGIYSIPRAQLSIVYLLKHREIIELNGLSITPDQHGTNRVSLLPFFLFLVL